MYYFQFLSAVETQREENGETLGGWSKVGSQAWRSDHTRHPSSSVKVPVLVPTAAQLEPGLLGGESLALPQSVTYLLGVHHQQGFGQ